jgi:hypothetical protein
MLTAFSPLRPSARVMARLSLLRPSAQACVLDDWLVAM